MRNIRKLSKHTKEVGKLSSKKIQLRASSTDIQQDKHVSAALPILSQTQTHKQPKPNHHHINKSRIIQKIHISKSLLLDDGREDPLPQITVSFGQPLQVKKPSRKNPQEQAYFIDALKKKLGKCIGTQKNEQQESLIGKLYSPRSSSLKIDIIVPRQAEKQIKKAQGTKKSLNFKNFLNHEYVKQLKLKQKGHVQVEDYNFKFNESTNSTNFKEELQNNQKKYNSFVKSEKIIDNVKQKPVYIGNDKSQTNFEVFLKNQGNAYVQMKQGNFNDIECKQEQITRKEGSLTIHPDSIIGRHDDQSEDLILIEYLRGISRIKQILIEQDDKAVIRFKISALLFKPIFQHVSQPEIHLFSETVFKELTGLKPQLISIKRFINCVLVTTKNPLSRVPDEKIGLLRHFSGRFYVGGWRKGIQNEGCKHGFGFEYTPNGKCFLYLEQIYFGQFKQNMRNGYGLQKKINGKTYVGEWLQGKRQGWGKTFANDCLQQDGNFEQDIFKASRLFKQS